MFTSEIVCYFSLAIHARDYIITVVEHVCIRALPVAIKWSWMGRVQEERKCVGERPWTQSRVSHPLTFLPPNSTDWIGGPATYSDTFSSSPSSFYSPFSFFSFFSITFTSSSESVYLIFSLQVYVSLSVTVCLSLSVTVFQLLNPLE